MTLAKLTKRSKSFMAAELIDAALALPRYREMLKEAAETVGTVPTKADPRDEQGIARRQPQLIKDTETEVPAHPDLDRLKGEKVTIAKTEKGPDAKTYTKFVEELVEAREEEAKSTQYKDKLGLSDEQDALVKMMRLDQIKPENREKFIALMQFLQLQDTAK